MELDVSLSGDTATVTVAGSRIDAAAAIGFKEAMRAAVPAGSRRVLLDLGQVAFIDSSGLGAIVSVMKSLGDGQRMELASLQPNVDRVFRLTRMDTVFVIHDRVQDAAPGHAG
ncbi:hypothetical protein ATO6_00870 [Oceanicola sp. 22II-s10i]|uniref:STAS domain-containing protein n=1 Tax=Oceanicola sp. 22II-s10i TaxID=1317116 RepID=UPI000B5251C5|nr:STAS domain-containing protein [Oceanicola sp. 22II-s10i]OWU85528.1 hypothetical protein ATO6_00870 [Oceanicola sp. 22II-s10i]